MPSHIPVMLEPLLAHLSPYLSQGYAWVDATVGLAGHSVAMLPHLQPNALAVLNDRDPQALALAQQRVQATLPELAQPCALHWQLGTLATLPQRLPLLASWGQQPACLLADLGVSSYQLDEASRGFSFSHDGPLDMRMNAQDDDQPTAAQRVNTATLAELIHWFTTYGEETLARPMAQAIVTRRQREPFTTTSQLANLMASVSQYCRKTPRKQQRSHPATRVFQALRIVVNNELHELETFLNHAHTCLPKGSVLAILTFHSLEDRIVKQWGKAAQHPCQCPPHWPVCQCQKEPTFKAIVRKPLLPAPEEVATNPRARSVKLRLYQRL